VDGLSGPGPVESHRWTVDGDVDEYGRDLSRTDVQNRRLELKVYESIDVVRLERECSGFKTDEEAHNKVNCREFEQHFYFASLSFF